MGTVAKEVCLSELPKVSGDIASVLVRWWGIVLLADEPARR
jgi:hypothetical protein